MQRAVKAAKAGNHNGHPLRSGVPMEAIEGADRYPQQCRQEPTPDRPCPDGFSGTHVLQGGWLA
jgi:hypothetical protein